MPFINCFECTKEISDTAKACPHCGFDLKEFYETKLAPVTIGIPIGPFEYWDEHHLWYAFGQTGREFKPVNKIWVNAGDPIYKYDNKISIKSPVTGRVLNFKKSTEKMNVGYRWEIDEFIEIQPIKGFSLREDIVYNELIDYVIKCTQRNPLQRLVSFFSENPQYPPHGLDPKDKFKSTEELIETVKKLSDVRCVELTKLHH